MTEPAVGKVEIPMTNPTDVPIPEDLREAHAYYRKYMKSHLRVDELIERIARAEAERDAARDEQKNLRSHLENGEEMFIAMRGRCAGVEADLFRCQDEYEKLEAENARLKAPVSDEEWSDCAHLVSMDEGRHYDSMIDRECMDSIIAARAGKEQHNG